MNTETTRMDAWREGREAGWKLALAIIAESGSLDHAAERITNLIDYYAELDRVD